MDWRSTETTEEVKNVATAIVTATDQWSSKESKNLASSYINSIYTGDIRTLKDTSLVLIKEDWSYQIRFQSFCMLKYLVRVRWEEVSSIERKNLVEVAFDLMAEMANDSEELLLKKQAASFITQLIMKEGVELWKDWQPVLISISHNGPIHATFISTLLVCLHEDITIQSEELEAKHHRLLLDGLSESLPRILHLLDTLLDRHFRAGYIADGNYQLDIATQHGAAFDAALKAVKAHAEWAPVLQLAEYGLVRRCFSLLSFTNFRSDACEILKRVCLRKRPTDASAEFDAIITNIFMTLIKASKEFSKASAADESEFKFTELLCETMASLGSSNLRYICDDAITFALYLDQMLGYFGHFKFALHFHSLEFWLALITELVPQPAGDGSVNNNLNSCSRQVAKEKKGILITMTDKICSAILKVCFQRLLKRENVSPGQVPFSKDLELWHNEFEHMGMGDFNKYRSKLLELIRFIALHKPIVAGCRVSERIDFIIKSLLQAAVQAQDLSLMESMQPALKTIVSAIFERSTEFLCHVPEVRLSLCTIFEGLLQQLLSLKWTEPAFAEVFTHYLNVLGPLLDYVPEAVGGVVQKLFELLISLPCSPKESLGNIGNSARHARLQIATSFIHIGKNLLPHMKDMFYTIARLQSEGRLLPAEHDILGEAILVMASCAGSQQQEEAFAWVLDPLKKQWLLIEQLSDYSSLVCLCSDMSHMRSLFHTVTVFEKALIRSATKKSNSNIQIGLLENPMVPHLSWMLPPLLRLLCAIHSLWSPTVNQVLPQEWKAALSMSNIEQASLRPKLLKATFESQANTNKEGHASLNENYIRNWLEGITKSGYNILGLSTTIGDSFFRFFESHFVVQALVENLATMELKHLAQLIKLVFIPIVKFCPLDLWGKWLDKLLNQLFLEYQKPLSLSWSILREGRATFRVGDVGLEVEELVLKNLTREICSLLSVLASPGLNKGIPSEQSKHRDRVEISSLKELDSFGSNSLIGFLFKDNGPALPATQISMEALTWADREVIPKLFPFWGSVIMLAASTNNIKLVKLVAEDLFCAIIQGLALESNACNSSDLIGLCCTIFIQFADRDPAPRRILVSLPTITHTDLATFEVALARTSCPKKQNQHMKNMLLKELGRWKYTDVIQPFSCKIFIPFLVFQFEKDFSFLFVYYLCTFDRL